MDRELIISKLEEWKVLLLPPDMFSDETIRSLTDEIEQILQINPRKYPVSIISTGDFLGFI
jgi:hypothetical protein